ncbi:hypothetical protein RUND412_004168 [Rhizina undulata]
MEPPMVINTLMVEGSFEDQVIELAQYLDQRKGVQFSEGFTAHVEAQLEKGDREELLKGLVEHSYILASTPEKEFIPAYNLLIHLIRSSENLSTFLPILLANLSSPPSTSTTYGPALSVHVLCTIFNILPANDHLRYPVFKSVLRLTANTGMYEYLVTHLKNFDKWVLEWGCTGEEIRDLCIVIANIAEEMGDDKQHLKSVFRSLQTFTPEEATSQEAHSLAVRAAKVSLNTPSHLEFDELIALDAVRALQNTDLELFALLEVFAAGELEDYEEFNDEHGRWIDEHGIDHTVAFRKIRLLTLASLAASAPNRELPYNIIARRLHVPSEEVEMWVIDVIRAGLVEGKLSQLKQTFLIHRSTHRSFGKAEWEQIGDRLDVWKGSLKSILEVVKTAREQVTAQNDKETSQASSAAAAAEGRSNSKALDV